MLKLEKADKSRELTVLLRAKQTFLTGRFLMALGYAVFVHVAAFFLFKVAPLKLSFQSTLFPPVNVAIDFPSRGGVYVNYRDEELVTDFPIVPEEKFPMISDLIGTSLMTGIDAASLQMTDYFFLDSENIEEFATKEEIPISQAIYISGALAEIPLIAANSEHETVSIPTEGKILKAESYLFRVLLDQGKGEIFWWETIGSDFFKIIPAEVLAKLESLRFVPDEKFGILSGEIEIVISL